MKKRLLIFLVAGLLASGAWLFAMHRRSGPADDGRLKVTTSFYPLFFLASEIGGGNATVYNLTPAGVEPHEYEPTPRDIARIENSVILFLNGAGLEPWAANISKIVEPGGVNIVVLGEGLAKRQITEGKETRQDPHVWLDPKLASQEAERMLQTFLQADPKNSGVYKENAAALEAKLAMLDKAYREGLEHCAQKRIVTSHAAFGYLAAAYGLEQFSIAGLSPEAEPSSRDLATIAELARKENIRYIFFEALVSPKLSETIAKEVGAQTLVLDPIESGPDYLAQMYANLANLQRALECRT